FGPMIAGRAFTPEQAWHSKTLIPSDSELFIHLGDEVERFGAADKRLVVPLPREAGYAAVIATAYFAIGRIQSAHPPYFKRHIAAYMQKASKHFGYDIPPIVE
ncbi:MAG: hypothetical protein AAB923_02445, partial [Patescibacteria group bacterium]